LPLPLADDTVAIVPWATMWRRDGWAFVALFALGLAFRVAVLVQTARTPFLEVANIDSGSYNKWAEEIARGAWWPTTNFYQSPFYAYFLGLVYAIFGDGPWAPRVLQIVFGSLTPVLAYAVATRLVSRRAGWVAGVAVALYGVLVLEEVTLSKTSLLVVIALAGVAAYLRYGPRAHALGLSVAGLCFGTAVVGVAQWLLTFVALAVYLPWYASAASREERLRGVVAFVGATMLVLLPVVAWNSIQGRGLVLTSGGSGLNLFTGNNERATGLPASPQGLRDIPEFEEADSRRLAEVAVGRPLSSSEVERYWSSQAVRFMREHPGDWLALLVRKLTVLWNAYEVPDNYHFTFMRTHFLPVLWLSVTLAVVGPLAIVGMLVPFWRRRGLTAFTLVWLGYMVTPILYYVRGRYRLPLVPFLAILAGAGVERLVRTYQARRWDQLGLFAGALLAATVFVNHTYCEPPHHGFDRLCFSGDMWFDQEWLKLAGFYEDRKDLDGTIDALVNAQKNSAPRGIGQMTFWRGDAERRKAEALASAGDPAGAAEHLRIAEQMFRKCIDVKYRLDASQKSLALVTDRLTTLQ
jgi:4-amino-4-deoxy-L-arabinose transferase-like glycosyltransferase